MSIDSETHLIPTTELKQWIYCPRIVYHHRVQGIYPPMTRKMREALDIQEEFERLEVRRQLDKYGLAGARREFGRVLDCPKLGLSGKLDLLVANDNGASVVDFKLTAREPAESHRLQLGAYGMMVEEALHLPVGVVFFYRIPDDQLFPIELSSELRAVVTKVIRQIRATVRSGLQPDATALRGRCAECEYANFCGDVW